MSKFNLHDPAPRDVRRFIESFPGKVDISPWYYSRVLILHWLDLALRKLGRGKFDDVCVVSGSENELELGLFEYDKLELFSYTRDGFNLDDDWTRAGHMAAAKNAAFDLILCNQVLEHLSDPRRAIRNLKHLAKAGGLIFISIPVLNRIHGDPDFYSSGYHPRLLERIASELGLEVVSGGYWGSAKYAVRAITGRWCSERELRSGFRSLWDMRDPVLALVDGRQARSPLAKLLRFPGPDRMMTDCWGLFMNPAAPG